MTGAPGRGGDALARHSTQLGYAAFLLAALVLAFAAGHLLLAWREIEARAKEEQSLYSRVLEGQANSTLNAVGSSLQTVADVLETRMLGTDPVQSGRLLSETIERQAALRSLSLLDENGRVLASSNFDNVDRVVDLAVLGGVPPSRKEAFGPWFALRDLDQIGGRVATPKEVGGLPLIRAVLRPGQSPLILVALLNPDRLATQQAVLIGDDAAGRSALFSFDGQVIAHGAELGFEPGSRPSDLIPFRDFLPGQEHGSYVGMGMTGERVVGGFRTLRNWPFVVVSEQPYSDLWDKLAPDLQWTIFGAALGWLTIGGMALAIRRGLQNERRSQEQLAALHESVARSEERWKLALEGAGDGVWDWHIGNETIQYSVRAQAILGLAGGDASEHVGHWLQRVHPEDMGSVREEIEQHLAGRSPLIHAEVRLFGGASAYRWVLLRGMVTPERDEQGRAVRLIGTMTDISARREAELALASSQARRQAVLESAMDAIVTFDLAGRVIDFNPAAQSMFGRTETDALKLPVQELIVPAHLRRGFLDELAIFGKTGDGRLINRRIETEAVRADGSTFPVELTIVPVRSDKELLFTATLRDISQRRRVERALRDSEARAQATFEQVAVGVVELDADSRVVRVNKTLCKLLGYEREEFLTLTAEDIIHPEDLDAGDASMRDLLAGSIAHFKQEKRYRRKDGRYVWVRLTAALVRNGSDDTHFVVGIVEDISVQRRAQEELSAARRRELQIGAHIQQSLLMMAPGSGLPGVRLSSFNLASQDIDGDFFEVIRPGANVMDLISGDVMGKGMNAALMGAAVKMQFSRSLVELLTSAGGPSALPEPAAVLDAVHRAMTPHLQTLDAFVTLSYVRIDLRTNTLSWVGCGHEEPLLVRRDGPAMLLRNQQPPLGVLSDTRFAQESMTLAPGDALLMHSDGVCDALTESGERVGHERVHATFERQARAHDSPSSILHLVRRELLEASVLTDDVSLLVACIDKPRQNASHVELAPEAASIPRVRLLLEREVGLTGLAEEEGGLFVVAVVEAFTNIFRHARGRIDGAPVEVHTMRTPRELVVELIYIGDPYTPPSDLLPTNFDEYPEGGFGLTIIRKACDRCEYLHHAGVNTTRLVRWIDG